MFSSRGCAPSGNGTSGSKFAWWVFASVPGRGDDSDVEEADVLGVLLDEALARLDVVTHERGEHLVGDRGLLDRDLEERARLAVHRGRAELLPVHLAETLEPADLDLATFVLRLEHAQRGLVLEVGALLADVGAEQRRLRDVHVTTADELAELAVEEREQQRADVRAVDVGVAHQDDLVVAELLEIELVADAGARRGDQRLDLLVLQHLVEAGALDVEDLPPDREDRLVRGVAGALGGAAGAVTLDDEELALGGVARRAVRELARHRGGLQQRLAAREVARLARRDARALRLHGLRHHLLGLGRVLLEPLRELLVRDLLDHGPHLGVAELGLGLTLELRVAQLHRDDRGETLADVLAEEVVLLLLENVLAAAVLVDHVGEGLLEALLVHAALGGRDVVRERVDALVVPGVPLQRDVDLGVGGRVLERDDALEDRLLGRVEVPDEVGDPAGELEGLLDGLLLALVAEADLEALVQESHLAQALEQRLRAELGLLEHGGVGPEGDDGAGPLRRCLLLELALRPSALGEAHLPLVAVTVDLEVEAARQRVHHRHVHAVEPAGDLVALAAELAAGVEHGQHDLGGGLVLVVGVVVDGDATTVVVDPAAAVGEQRHHDAGRVAGHRLVDRVVDHLVHQVMQTGQTGRSDVHAGAFANGLEALQHGDVLGAVSHSRTTSSASVRRSGGSRSAGPDEAGAGESAGRRTPVRRGRAEDPGTRPA